MVVKKTGNRLSNFLSTGLMFIYWVIIAVVILYAVWKYLPIVVPIIILVIFLIKHRPNSLLLKIILFTGIFFGLFIDLLRFMP